MINLQNIKKHDFSTSIYMLYKVLILSAMRAYTNIFEKYNL